MKALPLSHHRFHSALQHPAEEQQQIADVYQTPLDAPASSDDTLGGAMPEPAPWATIAVYLTLAGSAVRSRLNRHR